MSSTLRFVIRQDRPDKYGKCTVRLIYQISGDRKFIPYKKKLHPLNWDAAQQRAVFIAFPKAKTALKNEFKDGPFDIDKIILTDREIKDVNADLSKMATDIRAIEQRFMALKKSYTIQDIADEYKAGQLSLEKKIDERNSLHHFIGRYISDHSEKLTKGTITIYETLQGNIKDYQSTNKRVCSFDDVNYGFFQSFQNYLIKLGTLNNNTIAKKLSYLKTVINYAVDKCDIPVNQKYRSFNVSREEPKIIALTQVEFDSLLMYDFTDHPKLDRVRDVFCFSCATGLRMSDLAQLRREHISRDEINLVVQKTAKEICIPLNAVSDAILTKYANAPRPLPVISNQKLNEYIKDACDKAGINEPVEITRFIGSKRTSEVLPKFKLIHVHTGRKTFVTLSLERGMLAEHVMGITGHANYKAFKRYVDFTKKTAKVVMGAAWGEVPKLKVVS